MRNVCRVLQILLSALMLGGGKFTATAVGGGAAAAEYDAEMNRELIVRYSESYIQLYHQEELLGEELERKLSKGSAIEITDKISISASSTIRFCLTQLLPTSYRRPKVDVTVKTTDGVNLYLHLPLVTFEGKFEIDFYNGTSGEQSRSGNMTMTIFGTEMEIRREIVASNDDNESYRRLMWKSSECSVAVGDVQLDFGDDVIASSIFSRINRSEEIEKFQTNFCLLPEYLLDVDIESSLDVTRDMTRVIGLNLTLATPPIIGDGCVELRYALKRESGTNASEEDTPGKMESRKDNSTGYSTLQPPIKPRDPGALVSCLISEQLLNHIGFMMHQNQLLTDSYTKTDLNDRTKFRLDTTCHEGTKDCVGKLFPRVAVMFPGSVVEIHVSSAEPPRFQLISGKPFRADFAFDVTCKVRPSNETSSSSSSSSGVLLFSYQLLLSGSISPRISHGGDLRFQMKAIKVRVRVTRSKVGGVLRQKALKTISGWALRKRFYPALTGSRMKDFRFNIPPSFSVHSQKFTVQNNTAVLSFALRPSNATAAGARSSLVYIFPAKNKQRFFALIFCLLPALRDLFKNKYKPR